MRQRIRSFGKAIIKRLVSSGIGRAQILCLLAGSFLSAAYIFAGAQGSFLRDGRYILRGSYGEGEEEYELKVSGLGDEEKMISLTVSERKYTDQELQVLFSELAEQLPVIMAGDNKDLDNVDRDLYLPDSVDGFEGIRLSWYPEDLDLISYKGELKAEITGPEETGLSLVMKGGDISEEYFYRIRLIPAVYTEDEQLRRELISSIEKADKRNREGEFLELPTEVSGRKVSYSPAGDMTPVLIMTLSITAALLLWLRPAEEERKKQRERKESLRRDYPELVTRLLLYTGAGLTIKNAWISICGDMEEIDGDGLTRPLTGELRRTVNDMERAIESRCLSLILRQQPVAGDLRQVSTALKVVTDLERIGDHASDIAELILRIKVEHAYHIVKHLPTMAAAAQKMVHDAIEAFIAQDLEAAMEIIKRDDEVDTLFNQVKTDVIDLLKTSPNQADQGIDLLMVAKYLERIGDHAVNVCEWTQFSKTGALKNVRIM